MPLVISASNILLASVFTEVWKNKLLQLTIQVLQKHNSDEEFLFQLVSDQYRHFLGDDKYTDAEYRFWGRHYNRAGSGHAGLGARRGLCQRSQ